MFSLFLYECVLVESYGTFDVESREKVTGERGKKCRELYSLFGFSSSFPPAPPAGDEPPMSLPVLSYRSGEESFAFKNLEKRSEYRIFP